VNCIDDKLKTLSSSTDSRSQFLQTVHSFFSVVTWEMFAQRLINPQKWSAAAKDASIQSFSPVSHDIGTCPIISCFLCAVDQSVISMRDIERLQLQGHMADVADCRLLGVVQCSVLPSHLQHERLSGHGQRLWASFVPWPRSTRQDISTWPGHCCWHEVNAGNNAV